MQEAEYQIRLDDLATTKDFSDWWRKATSLSREILLDQELSLEVRSRLLKIFS